MAESRHELIAVRIRDVLAAITGDGGTTYWYTPDFVGRWAAFVDRLLDPTRTLVYWLIPGDEPEEDVEEVSRQIDATATWNVLCLRRRDGGADEDPYSPVTPQRETVVNRMVQDVKKKLRAAFFDPSSLGGYQGIVNLEVKLTDRSPGRTHVDVWDVAFLSVVVHYTYSYTEP